jgi:hypothetical protein
MFRGQILTELIAVAGRKGASMHVAGVTRCGDGEAGDTVRIGD